MLALVSFSACLDPQSPGAKTSADDPAPPPSSETKSTGQHAPVPVVSECRDYRMMDNDVEHGPKVAAGSIWACSWPRAAADAGVTNVKVALRACVDENGVPTGAIVLEDPGYGFVDTVRECMRAMTFSAAEDANGDPISAVTAPVVIHFRN